MVLKYYKQLILVRMLFLASHQCVSVFKKLPAAGSRHHPNDKSEPDRLNSHGCMIETPRGEYEFVGINRQRVLKEKEVEHTRSCDNVPITCHRWSTMPPCTDAVIWKSCVRVPLAVEVW